MKIMKPNAEQVWKQVEDVLVPRLRLNTVDRAVYSHLLRHSRLEGKVRLQFSVPWLARAVRLTTKPVRFAVRRLVEYGVLRLVERSKVGHLVDVRLPEEIRAVRDPVRRPAAGTLEGTNFLRRRALRQAVHARDHGVCFYCLRRLNPRVRCLDHVVPSVQSGPDSYRNLVSCCLECNSDKGEKPAQDFLRWLYREGRLTADELRSRLRALDDLASGKLRPSFARPQRQPAKPTRPAHTIRTESYRLV
jgi:5-methylcytosine-specific restriction endonuclease McrA